MLLECLIDAFSRKHHKTEKKNDSNCTQHTPVQSDACKQLHRGKKSRPNNHQIQDSTSVIVDEASNHTQHTQMQRRRKNRPKTSPGDQDFLGWIPSWAPQIDLIDDQMRCENPGSKSLSHSEGRSKIQSESKILCSCDENYFKKLNKHTMDQNTYL